MLFIHSAMHTVQCTLLHYTTHHITSHFSISIPIIDIPSFCFPPASPFPFPFFLFSFSFLQKPSQRHIIYVSLSYWPPTPLNSFTFFISLYLTNYFPPIFMHASKKYHAYANLASQIQIPIVTTTTCFLFISGQCLIWSISCIQNHDCNFLNRLYWVVQHFCMWFEQVNFPVLAPIYAGFSKSCERNTNSLRLIKPSN